MILNKFTHVFGCLILVIAISGCSRKKDKFINRGWHAVGTEYNILYNGGLALKQGKQEVATSYNENFWNVLPVERMQISEEISLPGTVKNESFKLAEEKATKAIQKHSMLIEGKEKNPQIDEAYLLLGKARYFDQRFFPALEAFNYILHKYPASNTINHAQIWREKTNIRLQNNKLAIKNLKRIIKSETLKDQDRADANAMLAQAFININQVDSAVAPIKIAAKYTENNDEKGRYLYIQGQLYNLQKKRDSANYAFNQIIDLNRKTPREYLINAQIEKTRNFNFETEDPSILLASLNEMEENRENRPFLDKIYFQKAEYYNHTDSDSLAALYYNKSLKEQSQDSYLVSLNYETLGNMSFDKALYREASAYYDSTLTKIPNNSRDYFFVQRKRDNLKEVIYYEEIAEKNDSILRFVFMPEDERVDYFTRYVNNLKEAAIIQAKEGEVPEAQNQQPRTPSSRNTPGAPPSIGNDPANTFYFYNPRRVSSGLESFVRTWGPRELKDNWRLNSGNITSIAKDGLDEVSGLIISNNPQFAAQTYIDQIPTDPLQISELEKERNDAYYSLGLIYKEKFNKPDLASERLTALLNYTNEERLVVPANYYLYLINLELNKTSEAEKYKQIVLNNYPDSRYASRINNPDLAIIQEDAATDMYKTLYTLFENGEFVKVIQESIAFINEYPEEELLPKIELLKARASGRIYGINAYKEGLSAVASNYPQTKEGVTALELLNTAIPEMERSNLDITAASSNMKLLYKLAVNDTIKTQELKKKLESAILDLDYSGLSVSQDVYNNKELFLVIHGLGNFEKAEGFAELLSINKKYKIELKPIIISSENYRVVQLKKNLETYQEIINKQEP